MKIKRLSLKSISLGISILLAANQSLYGNIIPQEIKTPVHLAFDLPSNITDFFIPSSPLSSPLRGEGRVRGVTDIIRDPNQRLIIYLEDAHGVTAAQKNIAETMREVSKEGNLKEPWVALEGTRAGEIDHRILSAYPHLPTKNKIAEELLAKGLLNGADYFAVRYKPKAKLFGVEEGDLAEQNREAYRNFLPLKSQVDQALRHLDKANRILKDRIYYGDLVELNQIVEKLEKDASRFTVHLAQLQYLGEKNKISLKKYPSLYQFLELKRLDAKITGRPDLAKERAEFSNLSRSLEGAKLFKDLNTFVEDLWNILLFYDEAKDAYFINRSVQFYKKLYAFSLTPDEYRQYLTHPKLYSFEALQEKIRKYYFILRPRSLRPTVKEMSLLESASQYPLNFYRLAEERNELISKNLAALLDQSPDKKVFFVAGGFHRDRITAALKGLQIPYVVMTPKISSGEGQENYWRLLGGSRSDAASLPSKISTVALDNRFSDEDFGRSVFRGLKALHFRSSHFPSAFRKYRKRLGYFDGLMASAELPSRKVRSEVRTISLTPNILLDKRYVPSQRLRLWVEDLSKKLNAAFGNSLNQNLLVFFLSQIPWIANDDDVEKKLAALLNEKTLVIEFSNDLSNPVEWTRGYDRLKNIALKIDLRAVNTFRGIKLEGIFEDDEASRTRAKSSSDYLTVLYIALTLRNYLVGHSLKRDEEMPKIQNSEKRDSAKRFEINRKYVDDLLNTVVIDRTNRDELQQAIDRLVFMKALAQINSPDNPDFGGSSDFLSKLQEQVNTFENWLSIALPFDATARELFNRALKAHRESRPAEAKALKARAEKIYQNIPLLNGRYQIVSYIASGGFGAVYKVFDQNVKDYRVVKIFDNRKHSQKNTFRLEREVELHKGVKGLAYFPQIHDQEGLLANPKGASGYLVLDLIEGKTVDKWLMAGLTVEQTVEIVMKSAVGLHQFHERGFVHRDLKPQNLMANIKNGNIEITVLDLGLAKEGEASGLTQIGTVMGTPGYIPPETAGYGGDVGPLSDVFQLGIILLQLFDPKGRIPGFQKQDTVNETILATLIAQYKGQYLSPKDMLLKENKLDRGIDPNQIDQKLNAIAMKAVALTPELLKRIIVTAAQQIKDAQKNKEKIKEEDKVYLRDTNGQELSEKTILQVESVLGKIPNLEDALREVKDKKEKEEIRRDIISKITAVAGKYNVLLRYETAGEFARDLKEWLQSRRKAGKGAKQIQKAVPTITTSAKKAGDPFLEETVILNPEIHPSVPKPAAPSRSSLKKYLILAAAAFLVTVVGTLTTVFWPGQTVGPSKTGSSQTTQPSDTISYQGSMEFRGRDNRVYIESVSEIDKDEMAISLWFQSKLNPSTKTLFSTASKKAKDQSALSIHLNGWSSIRVFYRHSEESGNWETEPSKISFNDWNHLVVNYNRKLISNIPEVYINGTKQTIAKFNPPRGAPKKDVRTIIVGEDPNGTGSFQGNIAGVEFFVEKILSENEVMALYKNSGVLGNADATRKIYWPLTNDTKDYSGHNNHGIGEGVTRSNNSPPVKMKLVPQNHRSEARYNEISSFYTSLFSSQNNALLIAPYHSVLGENLFKGEPYLIDSQNIHYILLAKRSEIRKAKEKYGHLERIYGFKIIAFDENLDRLKAGSYQLQTVLKRAALAFGIQMQHLGRPVVFREDNNINKTKPEDIESGEIIHLQVRKERLLQDPAYFPTNIIIAEKLSKKTFDMFYGLTFNPNGIEAAEYFIEKVRDNLNTILQIYRSA